ncbi:hypothetical protein JCM5296_004529 [Sporobolomyces johnsonii]
MLPTRVARSVQASAALRGRVARPTYLEKLAKPEDLVPHFKDGDYIGWSGFTGVGYPKMVPTAIADYVEANNLQGKMRMSLFVGASTGPEVEARWAKNDMIARRFPHQVGKEIAKGINEGRIEFADKHLSMFPQDLVYGYYSLGKKHGDPRKPLDWAIVEATEILDDGSIVPGASVGATPEILQSAEKIIIEVNTSLPSFKGLHDINQSFLPPHRLPYLVNNPSDRIGTISIPVDPERVIAIVESNRPDNTGENAPETEESKKIARNLIAFFEDEVAAGRMPKTLLPLQSGIGNVANSIIGGLAESPFERLQVWTEVLQDTFLGLFDSGKLEFATATSIRFSPEMFKTFYASWDKYFDKLLLRPQQVANSPEIIRRLGVIAMNTPLEVDMYAHANSTNAMGSRMLNGLGGSADFLRNALSIMHTPSARPTKKDPTGISCIVPFATHVDQTEHDLDVVVTDQGLADLRGLSPRQRAPVIIKNCAHPDYRDQLMDYYERALAECLKKGAAHQPHMLRNAFRMHMNLEENGTMKLECVSSLLFSWLAVTLLETIVDVVIVAVLLNSFETKLWQTVLQRDEKSVLPVYLGLFVLAHLAQLALAFDALVAKNTIQVVALLLFNTLFVVYAAIQIHEIRDLIDGSALKVLVWFIPGMISLTELTYILTIWPIYKEFGWSVFKRIGADRRIKRCYAWFQVFVCILKFDLFFFLAFSLQLVFLVPTQTSAERWLTVAALPVTLLILILGYVAVKREHRLLFWVFASGCALGCAYFIYKLFIISRDRHTDYKLVFKSLTVFAAFSLAALLWTAVTVGICYHNFERGLKYHMTRQALASTSQLDLNPKGDDTTSQGHVLDDYNTHGDMGYYGSGGHRSQYRMSLD